MTMWTENSTPWLERVIVTGGNGAVGSAVVSRFLEAGLEVISFRYGSAALTQLESEKHWTISVDLSDAQAAQAAVDLVESERGPIGALVHTAGGFRFGMADEMPVDAIDFLVDANLRSSLYTIRAVLGHMKPRHQGRVVLIGSRSTLSPGAGEGIYAATKAGLNALVESVAREVAADDITVNAVLPSIIDTPANREAMPEADFSTWVGREQLAEIIYALTQPLGAPISGALLPVVHRT